MPGRPLHRHFVAWLALLAMLWGALVPTLAQAAVSASSRQGWVEVCSASGVLWMRVEGGASSPAAPTGQPGTMADASAHCPWCPMQGASGLPPEPAQPTSFGAHGAEPTHVFTSARPAAVWPPAQSRAPPAA